MLGILSAVVGLLVLLWMFYDFFWPPPPLADRQLGKPDQPVEYNLKRTVSFIFWKLSTMVMSKKKACKGSENYLAYLPYLPVLFKSFKKLMWTFVLSRCWSIDLFYRYSGHIEFTRFEEYYGMPRGHSLSIYVRFSGEELHCIFFGKKVIITTSKHGTTIFFAHYNLFSRRT